MRKGLIAVTAILMAASFDMMAIEIGSVADARFTEEPGWTLDGAEMTNTRAKLLDPANFGPAGTYPEAVNITDVLEPISYNDLITFDIFFIGYFFDTDSNAFTANELSAMQNWVEDGGTMIITCDSPDQDAVCQAFGPTPSASNANPPVSPTLAGATRPPFDGPFGAPTELNMAGLMKYFDDTGGFMVLAEDQDGNPVVLEALIGDGRVVVFTDVDMIGNDTLSEGTGIENDNDQFLANLVAYLASEAGETFFLNPGMNGNWWGGPARGGEGAQLEVIITGEVFSIFLTFYSYDTEGNQIFLVAIGPINGNSAEVDVFITEGGRWGDEFDPAMVDETPFGTGTFSATNCGQAHILVEPNETYQGMGYTTLEYDLIRLATPAAPCPVPFPD